MKIYFAGSIRSGRQDHDWYRQIIDLLKNYGEVLTEHIGNTSLSDQGEYWLDDTAIFKRDLAWLLSANILVAEVTQPSTGVGYEIARAEQGGKKILCLFRENKTSRLSGMLNGNKNLLVKKYNDLEQVENILAEFFK